MHWNEDLSKRMEKMAREAGLNPESIVKKSKNMKPCKLRSNPVFDCMDTLNLEELDKHLGRFEGDDERLKARCRRGDFGSDKIKLWWIPGSDTFTIDYKIELLQPDSLKVCLLSYNLPIDESSPIEKTNKVIVKYYKRIDGGNIENDKVHQYQEEPYKCEEFEFVGVSDNLVKYEIAELSEYGSFCNTRGLSFEQGGERISNVSANISRVDENKEGLVSEILKMPNRINERTVQSKEMCH